MLNLCINLSKLADRVHYTSAIIPKYIMNKFVKISPEKIEKQKTKNKKQVRHILPFHDSDYKDNF